MEKDKKEVKKERRQVYTVSERNGRSYWIRIGAAFVNQDGSETLLLDALPVNARILIRDVPKSKEETPAVG